MSVSGLSELNFDSVDFDETDDQKMGNLGSRSVTRFKNDAEIAFLPFEKKYSLSRFCSEIPLAMTRCSKIEFDAYGKDQYGNSVGVKVTIYGDEREEKSETNHETTSDVNRDHSPDSRDRDFDRDASGSW